MSGETILVVEDEGIIAEYLRRMLVNLGYKVPPPLAQGETAVARALEIKPDLVLLDIMLAGKMNGIEAAAAIHEHLDVPVIYLSAYAEDALLRQAQMTDPYAYLVKPVQDRELRAAVEVALHKHALNQRLKESENKFRLVVESANEVFWLRAAETGELIYISPAYETIFDRTCAELYQDPQSFAQAIHPDDLQAVKDHQRRLFEQGVPFDLEYRILRPDGSQRWIWARSDAVRDERGHVWRFAGAAEDITARKQAEIEREALLEISQLFLTTPSTDDIYPRLCRALGETFDYPIVTVQLYHAEDGIMEFVGIHGIPTTEHLRVPVDQVVSGTVARTGNAVFENHVMQHTDYKHEFLRRQKVNALAAAPIQIHGKVLGVVTLADTTPRADLENIRGALTIVAAHLAQELARKQAEADLRKSYEDIQQQYNRLALLREIDNTISGAKDSADKMIRSILEKILQYLDVGCVALWGVSRSEQKLELSAFAGEAPGMPGSARLLDWNDMYALQVYNHAAPLFISGFPAASGQDSGWQAAMQANAHSFAMLPLHAKDEKKGVLGFFYRGDRLFQEDDRVFLASLATQVAIAIDNAQLHTRVILSDMEVAAAYEATLLGWAQTLELRDKETKGHCDHVVDLSLRLGEELGLHAEELIHLRRGAMLHDIGKLVIPDNVLKKPGPLTQEEWEVMKKHPLYAYQMLSGIPFLGPALDLPLHHHEWWNGAGYPDGLSGEQIPFVARLFAVVDVWDALNEDRPYRPAFTPAEARKILAEQSGIQFDPRIVDAFLSRVLPKYG